MQHGRIISKWDSVQFEVKNETKNLIVACSRCRQVNFFHFAILFCKASQGNVLQCNSIKKNFDIPYYDLISRMQSQIETVFIRTSRMTNLILGKKGTSSTRDLLPLYPNIMACHIDMCLLVQVVVNRCIAVS